MQPRGRSSMVVWQLPKLHSRVQRKAFKVLIRSTVSDDRQIRRIRHELQGIRHELDTQPLTSAQRKELDYHASTLAGQFSPTQSSRHSGNNVNARGLHLERTVSSPPPADSTIAEAAFSHSQGQKRRYSNRDPLLRLLVCPSAKPVETPSPTVSPRSERRPHGAAP